jgi:hypothetical protein
LQPERTDSDPPSITGRFKNHWFVSILVLCGAVVVATWGVAYEVLVSPRDFEIHKLEHEVAEKNTQAQTATNPTIVLKRTWVSEGSSVTTEDGSCLIHVDYVGPHDVELSASVGAEKAQKFKDVASGTRLTLVSQGDVYYVDIHEIHAKEVGIEITKQPIPKPTQK